MEKKIWGQQALVAIEAARASAEVGGDADAIAADLAAMLGISEMAAWELLVDGVPVDQQQETAAEDEESPAAVPCPLTALAKAMRLCEGEIVLGREQAQDLGDALVAAGVAAMDPRWDDSHRDVAHNWHRNLRHAMDLAHRATPTGAAEHAAWQAEQEAIRARNAAAPQPAWMRRKERERNAAHESTDDPCRPRWT